MDQDNISPSEAGEQPRQPLTTADLARAGEPASRDEARAFAGDGETQAQAAPLFPGADADALRSRWTEIQAGFVDEPRRAVEHADALVAEAIKRLADMFAKERSGLEAQWDRGDDVSTEDLRQALQRYRSFFTRLLAV